MYDAAHAILLEIGGDTPDANPKTHHGLVGTFGRLVVQPGHVDVAFGRSLNQVQQIRHLADYTGEEIGQENAAWAIRQAELFLAEIRTTIPTEG